MKRGRHDGDYERVRRQAGMSNRPRSEFPDEEEESAVAARVAKSNEEFKARMAELDRQELAQHQEAEERHTARRREIDRRMILAEYARLGLSPPGDTLVSLPLLIKLGWRIEEIDGKNVLVRPASFSTGRKTREDYERERAVNAEGS